MAKKVLVLIATGFEEVETLTVVDILRRAEANVVLAGVGEEWPVVGRSKVSVIPDTTFEDAVTKGPYDVLVLPGGLPNAYILRDNQAVIEAIKEQLSNGLYVGAICAAPVALAKAGVLEGRCLTSHPTIGDQLPQNGYLDERVVVDDRVITSRSPGTAMEFAFAIVQALYGKETVEKVNQGVLARL